MKLVKAGFHCIIQTGRPGFGDRDARHMIRGTFKLRANSEMDPSRCEGGSRFLSRESDVL